MSAIYMSPKRRSLQGTCAKVESKRRERIELPIGQRYGDDPENRCLGSRDIMFQQFTGPDFRHSVAKSLSFLPPNQVSAPSVGYATGQM